MEKKETELRKKKDHRKGVCKKHERGIRKEGGKRAVCRVELVDY